jgi:outer membrane protein OmpA-like peptidoglycan-associated protein
MAQSVYIPGLNGTIQVVVRAWFDPNIAKESGADAWADPDEYFATYNLVDRNTTTDLKIHAWIYFPNHTWQPRGSRPKEDKIESTSYFEVVRGKFTNVKMEDGNLLSDEGPISLQGRPQNWGDYSTGGPEASIFRYIDGKAVLSADAKNPRIKVIKIKLVLGSQDVVVTSWGVNEQDAQWKFGGEGGKGGSGADGAGAQDYLKKVIDIVKQVNFKVDFERAGAVTTNTRGMQYTPGQLSAQPEWTLSLVLPERKPRPQPITVPATLGAAYTKIYFVTGKSDLSGRNNDPSQFPNKKDQLKELYSSLDALPRKRITKIELYGHASGLGDTDRNDKLSLDRALYVKQKIVDRYRIEIKDSDVFAKGEPIKTAKEDNNPEDRRVDIVVTYAATDPITFTPGGATK